MATAAPTRGFCKSKGEAVRVHANVSIPEKESHLTAGLAGASRYGCVALSDGQQLLGVCEQQSVTRTRGAGFNGSGLPDDALDTMLERLGRTRNDVGRYVIAETGTDPVNGPAVSRINPHFAHARSAYLCSPFSSATIIVCDQTSPKVSVWKGCGAAVTPIEWPWRGPGFVDLYSACAAMLGFASEGGDQRFEALARTSPTCTDRRLSQLLTTDGTALTTAANWQASVEDWLRAESNGQSHPSPRVAASLQNRIGELFLEFLTQVKRQETPGHLCLAGTFFYHSSMITLAKGANLFSDVFVPPDPGNAGLAVGAALEASGCAPKTVSPFLGPAYDETEIKGTLDNCKLQYDWENDDEIIDAAVQALCRGRLVGWFEGPKEWGPRALGGRSILASPLSPYVLENLNRFLKRREPWRGYALSAPDEFLHTQFEGPDQAPFMECDYRPLDTGRFRHILPSPDAVIRVQSVGRHAPPRFSRLIERFGAKTGVPCLVNTSFNGFNEPMVCNPRDAVRVFYGSGVDMAVIERFVLSK